jgi:DNA repair exonuclease SbcCD ATPase subunit
MKQDKAEEEAARLLPEHLHCHCASYYRRAIAAALRQRDERIAELQAARQQLSAAQAEVEQLRHDNFELDEDKVEAQQAVNDMADEQIKLEAQLAEAKTEIERLKNALACDACDGSGNAGSGPCGCRGLGLPEMLTSVRHEYARAQAEIERLKAEKAGK